MKSLSKKELNTIARIGYHNGTKLYGIKSDSDLSAFVSDGHWVIHMTLGEANHVMRKWSEYKKVDDIYQNNYNINDHYTSFFKHWIATLSGEYIAVSFQWHEIDHDDVSPLMAEFFPSNLTKWENVTFSGLLDSRKAEIRNERKVLGMIYYTKQDANGVVEFAYPYKPIIDMFPGEDLYVTQELPHKAFVDYQRQLAIMKIHKGENNKVCAHDLEDGYITATKHKKYVEEEFDENEHLKTEGINV